MEWDWPPVPTFPDKPKFVFHITQSTTAAQPVHVVIAKDGVYELKWVFRDCHVRRVWDTPWEELVIDQVFDEKIRVETVAADPDEWREDFCAWRRECFPMRYRPFLKWSWSRIAIALSVLCAYAACLYVVIWALWL